MPKVLVTKIRGQDIHNAVKSCFEIVANDLLSNVKNALIKPNFVVGLPASSGVTTDLRIIKSLIKILKEKGIEVIVGESSLENTQEVFKSLNVFGLEKLGAHVVNFDLDEEVKVRSPKPLCLGEFHIPKTVFDCDLFISVGKMKTHSETGVTLSIKNVLGVISKKDRKAGHIIDIHKTIVEVFAYLIKNKKFISFVDGIYALEGKLGPTSGNAIKMDLIIAGNDPVATDTTCVELMGYEPKKVKHIYLSDKFGLGKMNERDIIGEKIEDVKRKFEMPILLHVPKQNIFSLIIEKLFKKIPYRKFKEKCILCGKCVKACPMGAIFIDKDTVRINYKRCISCLVCCESCKEGAMDYKISNFPIYKVGKNIVKIYHRLMVNFKQKEY